ncbi:exonuclease domain-containing protein [Aquisalimonas sp.]|uniref:exonuclease domain-containing protein n=1 Tax=Aquisalimonas sp. TaxID=1872621 RepID=UPI0025C3FBEF|nr:exonuclease domain-containing protein [Aquisalimonas sp.]
MQAQHQFALIFVVLALVAGGVTGVAVHIVTPPESDTAFAGALLGGLSVATLVLIAWFVLDRLIMRPARKLVRGIRALLESRSPNQSLPLPRYHALGSLPDATVELATALKDSRQEIRQAMDRATAQVEEQKTWLEVILQSLSEGVLVCNRRHQILLYNNAAVSILGLPEAIGLGRPLFNILSKAPVQHTLERLERHHGDGVSEAAELTAPFVCSSADARQMLHARIALILDQNRAITGHLITLIDISEDVALLARGDAIRLALTRDLRGVVGNIRAAAETLNAYPDMTAEERHSFDDVILNESETLSRRIEELGQEIRGQLLGRWPMADLFISDLVSCVQERLRDLPSVQVNLVGMPLWLHGDSLSLMQALDCLIRQLHEETEASEFDIESLLADQAIYLEVRWAGKPLSADGLEAWLDTPCDDEASGQRIREVLERHECEPWSQAGRGENQAVVRLPLPTPTRPQFFPEPERLPARPEFYDFGLMQRHADDEELAATPLRDLSFVVFDCEMTGLDPMGGDEIIAIAGVRVVKHRVLTGETFERLVNPGRPIPEQSVQFHGITDDQVQDKPAIQLVLRQFKDFVGDAVMVAHNAAFDMQFISLKQHESGVEFDNPVLDTLLLSSMLDGDEEDHSLDALCERYGITISGRHSALGDTLGTAELLVRMIDRLEAKGFETFGEVMKASNMAAQIRHRSAMVASSQHI